MIMKVWEITGFDLEMVLGMIQAAQEQPGGIYKLSFCDDGGAKIKVNEWTWTPPMGTVRA
jgi:hypothetical protein